MEDEDIEYPASSSLLNKTVAYLEQENAVLHERVRKLEADHLLRARETELALWNIRAIAAQEQEQPSGLHMTAFSLIQKYATQALGDEDLP